MSFSSLTGDSNQVSHNLLTVILGSVVVFLLVVIFGLILKVTTSHTGNLSLIDVNLGIKND